MATKTAKKARKLKLTTAERVERLATFAFDSVAEAEQAARAMAKAPKRIYRCGALFCLAKSAEQACAIAWAKSYKDCELKARVRPDPVVKAFDAMTPEDQKMLLALLKKRQAS